MQKLNKILNLLDNETDSILNEDAIDFMDDMSIDELQSLIGERDDYLTTEFPKLKSDIIGSQVVNQ